LAGLIVDWSRGIMSGGRGFVGSRWTSLKGLKASGVELIFPEAGDNGAYR